AQIVPHPIPTRRSSDLYLLQLLNEPSHRLEGRDHFEDAYHEALSGDAVKRIRVLSLDLRDRPLKLMLAGRSSLNLLNFLHQHPRSEEHTSDLQSQLDLV